MTSSNLDRRPAEPTPRPVTPGASDPGASEAEAARPDADGRTGRRSLRAPGRLEQVAYSRFAVPALGLLSFLDACVSPILPEVVLVPLCLTRPSRRWVYAAWASATSVVGAVCGYYLGYGLWENGLREFAFEWVPGFSPEAFATISTRYGEAAFTWIVVAAFTPLPFKVFTVIAGVCHEQVTITALVLGSLAGRFPRFYLEVMLIHRLGPKFLDLMRGRVWLVTVLLALAVVLWYWLR